MEASGIERSAASHAPESGGSRRWPVRTIVQVAILVILAGWALRAAAPVVVPFVAALFIALAVAPVDAGVRERMPRRLRWLGHAAAMTLVLVILVAFFFGVYLAAQQAASQLPNVADQLTVALPGGAEPGRVGGAGAAPDADGGQPATPPAQDAGTGERAARISLFGLQIDAHALFDRTLAYLAEHGTEYGRAILSAAAGLITGLVLVFFLALLMLVEGPVWRDKMANAWSRGNGTSWEDTFAVMARSFRWYILVTALLGAITATLYVAWLGVFGIGLLVVWWVLTFLLSFIPTLGSVIAGALPIAYTFVTRDWTTAVYIAIGIVAIEQVMGNFASPRLLGTQLSVSPIVTFLALLLFGWMWGVVGALLAVPMAIFAVIACAHSTNLLPVALLLSDQRDLEGLRAITTR